MLLQLNMNRHMHSLNEGATFIGKKGEPGNKTMGAISHYNLGQACYSQAQIELWLELMLCFCSVHHAPLSGGH